MIRRALLILWLASLVALASGVAQEPPSDRPERIKKKVRPDRPTDDKPAPAARTGDDPKAKAKDTDKAKDKDTDKAKAKDGKDDPPPDPEKESKEILARIGKNLRAAEDRLKAKDAGDGTQQLQRDVVKDIDALLQARKNQQQQQQDQQQQQQAGQPGGGKPKGGGQQAGGSSRSRGSRASRGQRQGKGEQMGKGNTQQQKGNDSKTGQNSQAKGQSSNQGGMGNGGPTGVNKLADLYKDVWGHLPETMRQEIDAYQKEGYMTKYRELLKQYYATIAEKGRLARENDRRNGENDR